MQFKFRSAIILFIILILSLTACGSGAPEAANTVPPVIEGENPNTSASNGICANQLYPTTQGATWVYSNTGGPNGDFYYTNLISSVHAEGFTLTSQFANQTRTQEWSCQPDGIRALQLGGGNAAGISIQEMTANLVTSNVTGLSMPREVTAGMQWQYSLTLEGTIPMLSDPQAPSHGTYSVTLQELGRETITVPAGTFEAIKIQANSTVDIVTVFEGNEVPIKFNGTTITWYAPGVGYVKSVENSDFSGEMYSATTELLSYNIP